MEVFGDAKEFPYAATTYRLTEHFHFWTKHVQINAVLQPEFFVEISEQLAKEKGIKKGGWVRVWSKRGSVKAKAVVTKRIKPLMCDGKTGARRRHPAALGLHRRGAQGLRPQLADALRGRRQHRDAGIQGVPGGHRAHRRHRWHREEDATMATFQPFDVIRRSASVTATPPANRGGEVVKLIDTSKCIGCKACQSACLEWNDMRETVGVNVGVVRQPARPDAQHVHAHALHGVGQPQVRQPRVADPQGRLHALRGPGLPQGLPGARRHRAVRQRHRRLRARELHRLRLLREGVPVQHPAHLPGRPQGLQVHAVLGPGGRRPAAGLRQGVPDALHQLRHQGGDGRALATSAIDGPQVARVRPGGALQSAGRQRHARHVRAASRGPAAPLRRPSRQTRGSARSSSCGRASASMPAWP